MYDCPSWLCPATTLYPAVRAMYLMSTAMRQTRSIIVIHDLIVNCGSDMAPLEFPERCPGLVLFLNISFRTDRLIFKC